MRAIACSFLVLSACGPAADIGQIQAAGSLVADTRGVFATGARPDTPKQGGLYLMQVDTSASERIAGGDGVLTIGAPLVGDETSLYFAGQEAGAWAIYRLGREVGAAPSKLAPSEGPPTALALDGTSLYWALTRAATGEIHRVALTGGAPELVRMTTLPQRGLAIDATSVYWSADDPNTGIKRGLIVKAKKDPAGAAEAPVTLASKLLEPGEIALTTDAVIALDPLTPPGGCTNTPGSVIRVPISGAASTAVISSESGIAGLVVVGTDAWYGTGLPCGQSNANSAVQRIRVGEDKPQTSTTVAGGQSRVVGITVDARYVYWTVVGTGTTDHAVLRRASR